MNTSASFAEDAPVDLSGLQQRFVEKLNIAHRHIEERFTAGGEALMTVMDVINRLIGSLDRLTGALDDETAAAAMDSLQQTTARLADLPDTESDRGRHFREIVTVCGELESDVTVMREIMRYLLSIAVTVKITGASLPDFAEFADEIRGRTQTGSSEVESFVHELAQVRADIERACAVSENMVGQYRKVLPGLVETLNSNSQKIAAEHQTMAQLAAHVRQLASGVQTKTASVLSNLQIGDITRQRIEHVRSVYAIFDAFLAEHPELEPGEVALTRSQLTRLCRRQLEETLREFFAGSAKVMTGMTGLTSDANNVLATRNDIVGARTATRMAARFTACVTMWRPPNGLSLRSKDPAPRRPRPQHRQHRGPMIC